MASTFLQRTFDQVGDRQKWTFSAWIKRSGLGSGQNIFSSFPQASDYQRIMFSSSDKIYYCEVAGNSTNWEVETTAVYRDVSAWYHLVLRQDTTQASANDRVRIYINNVQQTLGTNTQPAQNRGTQINTADVHKIGKGNTGEYFDGLMSHIHWCDGQSYAPTEFGEADSNGVWKIKTSPSVTYGTNGFFILKDGNSVTDQGGGSHNWTVGGGTLTNMKDNPSNNYATISPLDNYFPNSSFANCNTYINTSSSNYTFNNATLGYTTGKWYWEIKVTQNSGYDHLGITSKGSTATTNYMYNSDHSYTLKQSGVLKENTGSGQQTVSGFSGTSYTTNIISIAHDATNNKIYFAKDGVWMNSANPNTPTGGITTTAASATDTGVWLPAFGDEYASGASIYLVNFGNGYFGTTAVSSAGNNASGHGIFEYDVPTGYTALCTKGLNGE